MSKLLDTDICIIGAGAAGISIANELNGKNINVLLIESGTAQADEKTQNLYSGESVGPSFPPDSPYLSTSRLRFFGGSTNHWSGWCFPLSDADFSRSLPGDVVPPWPIHRRDVIPYYQRASEYLEIPSFFENEINQYSKPFSFQPELVEEGVWQSPPTRFGMKYRKALDNSKNIKIIFNCNLVEIVKKKNSNRIGEVVCLQGGHQLLKIRAKCFVLACGGLENARLLMTAGRQLPLSRKYLGACFMEHPSVTGDYVLVRKESEWENFIAKCQPSERKTAGKMDFHVITLSEEILRRHSLPQLATVFLSEESMPSQDPIERLLRSEQMRKFSTLTLTEVRPQTNCRLYLKKEKDWTGLERVKLDWRLTEKDMNRLQKAMDIYSQLAAETGVYRVKRKSFTNWAPEHYPNGHHIGTTRMASESRYGVVNSDCRLFHIENFFVAGSSVFSTAGVATPTFTITALAIRLSDHIKKIYGVTA